MTFRRAPGTGELQRPAPGPDRVRGELERPTRSEIAAGERRPGGRSGGNPMRRQPASWLTCAWCGRSGRGVVSLMAGRAGHGVVVAAICQYCVLPDDAEAPAGPVLIAASAIVAVGTVWLYSAPGSPSGVVGLLAAAAWVVTVVAYGIRASRAGWTTRSRGLAGLRSWRWAVPPLLGALTATLVVMQLPVRLRFMVSRGAIERAVERTAHGAPPVGRVGAFAAATVTTGAGVTAVRVSGECGFFKAYGPGTSLPPIAKGVDVGGGWRAGCLPVGP